jgi:3-hydroxyacyl-CoA dehydrogenase
VKYDHWISARKVCVIGAGTMGSGIAAHLANIGFEVSLLDRTQESVEEAFDRARHQRPPHFFTPAAADAIRLGSIQDNLEWAAEADWICEAIIEKIDAKRALFAELDQIVPESTAITTNTSGLQISLLSDGLSEPFRKKFMGTHFFNPPRYLKLLELIPTADTDPKAVQAMRHFLDENVARRVVVAKDTPGFIANRFGMWAMFHAVHVTERLRLCIEEVDAITGPFLGRPRSGSFRLNDLVGIDIMLDIARNLYERCPEDPFRGNLNPPNSVTTLMSRGWIGDKSGQGYYKKEGKELVALDLQTLAYRHKREVDYPALRELSKLPLGERVGRALDFKDEVGEFLRHHLVPVLKYADYLKEEISHSVLDFDRVMMWGFGWEMGPFAMIDAIGAEKLGIDAAPYYEGGKMRSFGGSFVSIPKEPQYQPLAEYELLESRQGFNLRDLGDGVVAVCLTTKMGTINPHLVEALHELLDSAKLARFVFTSEAKSFSAGFDLQFFLDHIVKEDLSTIESAIQRLQDLANKISRVPSVAAVYGHCLGAGYELASRCSVVVALSDSQIGLPEAKVGLVPGGGGTALMRVRNQSNGAKGLADTVLRMVHGVVSSNADDARGLGYLRPTDVTIYHPDRLIYDAKKLALDVKALEEEPLMPAGGPLPGMIDTLLEQKRTKGDITEYDEQIGLKIKSVFSKATSFEEAIERERQVFMDLCGKSFTLARIRHMLESGKPLRN